MAVAARLSPAELALFERFGHSDQWHSYRVMVSLEEAGHTQPDLLKAALLHDVGKTQVPLSVLGRSLIVLGGMLWPEKTVVLGQNPPIGWKRPFVVKVQHPAWGAEMAAAAGSSPLTVELIRRHQDKVGETAVGETHQLLRLLQWADDLH